MNIHKLETWHFGINNDELVNLVLSLEKTATTYLKKDEKWRRIYVIHSPFLLII